MVWDAKARGLGLRVETSGTKTFILDYRANGRRRQLVLDRFGSVTVDQARALAAMKWAAVAGGADPLQDQQDARVEYTLKDFAAKYLEYVKAYKKPASLRADTYALDEVIVPKLGSRKLSAVTREDVARLHHAHAAHPAQANRMLATLSHLFTVAAAWGRLPQGQNPCLHVPKFREARRERYLSGDELTTLGEVLKKLEPEHPFKVRAVKLLLLTGCRLNEILFLAWSDVDLDRAVLHLRDAKAGPRDVPLGGAAIALLAAAERDSEWVIPSRGRKGHHLVNLSSFWHKEVITAAKLDGVRLHDLRHTVGSVGAGAGLSMLMIGNVLGHKQVSTTERYSHLSRGPLHEAADRISGEIAAALEGQKAEVVELRK